MSQSLPLTTGARDCLIAGSVLWVAGAIVVFFRCMARIRAAGMGIDDYLSIVATVLSGSSIGMSAAVFAAGVGYDLDPASPVYPTLASNLARILELTFAYTLIYIWALGALKLSQLFLYLRTFRVELKRWIYAGIAIVMVWGVCFTFSFIFLCDPVAQQWTLERIGKCMDQITMLKSLIMTNVITDLFIVLLPIRTIWQLQMRSTEKAVVTMCFAMGLACCVIGIVRFVFLFEIDLLGNLTGTAQTTFILVTVELVIAVLCINIPTLRPYYLRYRSRRGASGSNGKNSGVGSSFGGGNSNSVAGAAAGYGRGSRLAGSAAAMVGGSLSKDRCDGAGNYAAWIELNDTEAGAISDDAGSESERKLTSHHHAVNSPSPTTNNSSNDDMNYNSYAAYNNNHNNNNNNRINDFNHNQGVSVGDSYGGGRSPQDAIRVSTKWTVTKH